MKKTVFVLFIFVLAVVSCNSNVAKKKYYVISENSNNNYYKDGELEYGYFNFILTKDNRILLHSKHHFTCCRDVISDSDTLIPFLSLKPSDLTELQSAKEIHSFIKANIKDSIFDKELNHKTETYIVIASESDSIFNTHFDIIRKELKGVNVKYYRIRLLSEEEEMVLDHFINQREYFPDKINWKTNFLPEEIPVIKK